MGNGVGGWENATLSRAKHGPIGSPGSQHLDLSFPNLIATQPTIDTTQCVDHDARERVRFRFVGSTNLATPIATRLAVALAVAVALGLAVALALTVVAVVEIVDVVCWAIEQYGWVCICGWAGARLRATR